MDLINTVNMFLGIAGITVGVVAWLHHGRLPIISMIESCITGIVSQKDAKKPKDDLEQLQQALGLSAILSILKSDPVSWQQVVHFVKMSLPAEPNKQGGPQ
jgi:hypothetical protein